MEESRSGTVLVLRGGALGDFLLTRPALRRLRVGLPEARIVLVADRRFGELAWREGLVDELLRLDHAGLAPFFARGVALPQAWVERFQQAGLVVSWLFDPLEIFAENLRRIGVRGLLQGVWKPLENGEHASGQLGRVLEQVALFEEDAGEDLGLRWAGMGDAGRELNAVDEASSGGEERRVIGFHPGSGGMGKMWPWGKWLELLATAAERWPGWRWVMVTGEAEEERGLGGVKLEEAVVQLPEAVGWLRAPGLVELVEAMSGWRGFVGHDTGPSHLAAAVGVPTLALFGPTDPEVWAPLGARVIQAPAGDWGGLEVEAVARELARWGSAEGADLL